MRLTREPHRTPQRRDTPLHLACAANMAEAVRFLLKRGAKKHVTNAVRPLPPLSRALNLR